MLEAPKHGFITSQPGLFDPKPCFSPEKKGLRRHLEQIESQARSQLARELMQENNWTLELGQRTFHYDLHNRGATPGKIIKLAQDIMEHDLGVPDVVPKYIGGIHNHSQMSITIPDAVFESKRDVMQQKLQALAKTPAPAAPQAQGR